MVKLSDPEKYLSGTFVEKETVSDLKFESKVVSASDELIDVLSSCIDSLPVTADSAEKVAELIVVEDAFLPPEGKDEKMSAFAVVFVEVINLVKFEEEIIKIETELKINSFHWSEERWQVRNKFLARLVELDFEVKVAIFKNPANPEKAMSLVFEHLITQTNIRNLFIDGKKPRWYEQNLKRELRDKGISVKKLRTVNDKSQPGIQAADCLAGLVRRHYNLPAEEDAKKWFDKLVKKKKLMVQLLFEV